jgi:hypothetical protein
MMEAVIKPDNDIYIAFSVDIRIIPIGPLQENFIAFPCVWSVLAFKDILDRVVGGA